MLIKMSTSIKRIAFVIVFAGLLQSMMAQIRVYPVFNSIGSGRSINLLASKQMKYIHELGGGLRININKYAHNDDQDNVYKKRMYATKPLHYFGVEGFYHIHLLQRLQHFDFFAFYDIQLVYSTTGNRLLRHEIIDPYTGECEINTYFRNHGPFTWIEQNIGIGFTVDIWKNFFLTQRLGGGVRFMLGMDTPPNGNKDYWLAKPPFEWEFGYVLSVGIGYRFEPKK